MLVGFPHPALSSSSQGSGCCQNGKNKGVVKRGKLPKTYPKKKGKNLRPLKAFVEALKGIIRGVSENMRFHRGASPDCGYMVSVWI